MKSEMLELNKYTFV